MKPNFKFNKKKNTNPLQHPKRLFNFADETNVNLQQNTRFQFAQKHALSLYSSKAIYSFIPKNGCTTLRASLATENGFLEDINHQINWLHNNSYTFSASLKELITSHYTFTVLRCPYSRLISMFLDKFVDKTPVAWTFYRNSNNKYDLDDITFRNFIDLLLSQPNLINADIHWKKQSDFLIYKNYDDYFDFDNFNHIQTTLGDKINLELIDTRKITGHGRESYTHLNDMDYSEIPVSKLIQLKKNKNLPSINSMINAEDLKLKINNIYKIDFELRKRVIG